MDEKYLRPTPYLDWGHPAVSELARSASEGAATDRERAVRLYLRVRDDVRYDPYAVSLEPAALTASATLERGRGFCVTKAILYAAGLRALSIPSRLGFADVVNHLATERLRQMMRTEVFAFHGYTEVWLAGRWIKATPAFNATLCAKFGTAPLDFDGVRDSMLQPHNARGDRFMEYLRDRGTFDDFSLEAMLDAWREVYPHFYTGEGALIGDFEAEAAGEHPPMSPARRS